MQDSGIWICVVLFRGQKLETVFLQCLHAYLCSAPAYMRLKFGDRGCQNS